MDEVQTVTSSWKHWHYKNTALLILSLIIFFLFVQHPVVKSAISFIGNFGYIGAIIAGILFVSIFTVAPAAVILFFLADTLNPLLVALFAGMGAVVGDYFIFKFLRDKIFYELKPLFVHLGGSLLLKLFRTPHFAWLLPVFGVLIITSPAPDEIGIGILGASKLKSWQFIFLTFLLHTIGISVVIIAARSF